MRRFRTAAGWFRPVLIVEESLLRRLSGHLPLTADLLGTEADLQETGLGVPSVERLPTGNNASPYLPQHVQRYVWAMERIGGKRVVDLGCGNGYGTELLAWAAREAIGLDCDQDSVEQASSLYSHASYRVADLESPDDIPRADVGVCFEVLEHLDQPFEALRAIAPRVDRLLLSIPNPLIGGTHINPHHRSDRTLGQWKRLVKAAAVIGGRRAHIKAFRQGVRSPGIQRGATPASGVWILDVTFS